MSFVVMFAFDNGKSTKGKHISASVENITSFGIWIFVKDKEYFLSYKESLLQNYIQGIEYAMRY